jgi:hypothetical protein
LGSSQDSLQASLRSDWRKACATSAATAGGAPGTAASGTAKEVSGQAILKFDLRMSLAKASGNHKGHKDFHLHVVLSFVFFVNFVVKHYPQVSGPGAPERRTRCPQPDIPLLLSPLVSQGELLRRPHSRAVARLAAPPPLRPGGRTDSTPSSKNR